MFWLFRVGPQDECGLVSFNKPPNELNAMQGAEIDLRIFRPARASWRLAPGVASVHPQCSGGASLWLASGANPRHLCTKTESQFGLKKKKKPKGCREKNLLKFRAQLRALELSWCPLLQTLS